MAANTLSAITPVFHYMFRMSYLNNLHRSSARAPPLQLSNENRVPNSLSAVVVGLVSNNRFCIDNRTSGSLFLLCSSVLPDMF